MASKSSSAAKKKFSAVKNSAIPAGATDGAALECLRAQTGGADLQPMATLSGLGVDSAVLAKCLNGKSVFGGSTPFKSTDFPGSTTVAEYFLIVRHH